MPTEFEPLARRVWTGDGNAALIVEAMTEQDRAGVQQAVQSLFGVSVDLSGSVADINAAIIKAKEV